ncbi:MAG: decaprenyl-phosphate phosphoribosyltransferase [Nannocystaceae bacterium]
MLPSLLKTLRPKQWFKNLFVGVPLMFGLRLTDTGALLDTLAAFTLFCLVSGCVYVLNDLVDVEKDRQHPTKCRRPIAAGELSPRVARGFLAAAIPLAFGAGYLLAPKYAFTLAAYFALNLGYSFAFKRVPYLDVACIASGFVLRVLAGAYATDLPPSEWLMVCTALLSLFQGFGKRAHELAAAGESAAGQRAVLAYYRLDSLRWILHVLAVLTAVAYGMYVQSDYARATFGGGLIYTLPFSIIGILRFIHLATSRYDSESPTEEMLRDPLFMANFITWLLATASVLYFGDALGL